MPEGPEIYSIVTRLKKNFINSKILSIDSFTNNKVILPSNSSYKIIDIDSKGKLFWFKLDNFYIHIHLMLTGWPFINKKPDRKIKYIIKTDNKTLYITSQRYFTNMKIKNEIEHNKEINELGPDILKNNFQYDDFKKKIKNSRANICNFLLDQSKFSGIGNYIKSDCLYLAKISPFSTSNELKNFEIDKLYHKIKVIAFSSAIQQIRSYNLKIPNSINDNKPNNLLIPYHKLVYHKDFDPLGNKVVVTKIYGRKTFYVPKLQS